MKCMRVAFEADVEKYEAGKGMEDGFELWTDVVTRGWFVTDSLVQIKRKTAPLSVRIFCIREERPLSVREITLSRSRTVPAMSAAVKRYSTDISPWKSKDIM